MFKWDKNILSLILSYNLQSVLNKSNYRLMFCFQEKPIKMNNYK